MVTEFPVKNMLPLNLWSKQSLQAAQGSDTGAAGSGGASLLAQMPFGHPLAATPGFLPVSFSSALFRPGDHAPHGLYSYPALHPSFFRPHLDPAALGSLLNPRSMAALHHGSVGVDASRESHPSAFTPAKRHRLQEEEHSPRDGHSPHSPKNDLGSRDHDRDTSGSSNRTSPMTPVLHRHSFSPATGHGHRMNGDHMDPHIVNGAEDLRMKWRCEDGDNLRCPICKALLQPGEIRTHLYKEFTSLKESLHSQQSSHGHIEMTEQGFCDNNDSSKSRYDTFLRIRRNRENRLGKLRGDRKRKRYSDEMSHTSFNEHDDTIVSDHNISSSPNREPIEDETVDVTSCEEPEVSMVYSPSPRRSPTDSKEEPERSCPPLQPPFSEERT